MENLDVNSSDDEIAEYIGRFNFCIDTKETSDDKAIKGAYSNPMEKRPRFRGSQHLLFYQSDSWLGS